MAGQRLLFACAEQRAARSSTVLLEVGSAAEHRCERWQRRHQYPVSEYREQWRRMQEIQCMAGTAETVVYSSEQYCCGMIFFDAGNIKS
jgi:hypothetical protein